MAGQFGPDELYRRGLQHLQRGEWQAAIDAPQHLPSDRYTDAERLIADARLKLQFENLAVPPALTAPPRPILLPVFALAALVLFIGGVYAFARIKREPPAPTLAQTLVTSTPSAPTITPQREPTIAPTIGVILPATVTISAAENDVREKTPQNIELIIDASGSMLPQLSDSNKQRWQVVQEALRALTASGTITDEAHIAVRTYGQRHSNDCGDMELAQPLSRFNAEQLNGVIDDLTPAVGGMTPLAAALQATATDLEAAKGSTTVILLTDGLDSCNGDPVAEAAAFVKDQPQRNIHVIGFAMDSQDASAALQHIATNGNGRYFAATDGPELIEALRQSVALTYRIVASDGTFVAVGALGQTSYIPLMPGTYQLQINSDPPFETTFAAKSDQRIGISIGQTSDGLTALVTSE